MGAFTRMHGLVYNLDKWSIKPREDVVFDRVIGGIDWGYHNPAISVIGIRADGYYIIDEWSEAGKTTEEIIDAAIEMQATHRVSRWYADSANPENVQLANKMGLYCHAFKKKMGLAENGTRKSSIQHGISVISQMVNEHRLFVWDDLKKHLSEFEAYHYPEEGAVAPDRQDLPVAKDNHFMDAMRYAILGDDPKSRRQPKGKGWMETVFGKEKSKKQIVYQLS
jgi:hypothetical protein